VVGVCAAGKTTLVEALRARGFNARRILQEHSYVPEMWQRIVAPDVLIYLDAGLATVRVRRRDPTFPEWLWQQENERLRHARTYCDFYLQTDDLTPAEVAGRVEAFLNTVGSARPAGDESPPF
jgi:deoxyadenosine/deoxycytidine kinase